MGLFLRSLLPVYVLNTGRSWWKTGEKNWLIITTRAIVWSWLRCSLCFLWLGEFHAGHNKWDDMDGPCFWVFIDFNLLYSIMGGISRSCTQNFYRMVRCHWGNIDDVDIYYNLWHHWRSLPTLLNWRYIHLPSWLGSTYYYALDHRRRCSL